MSIHKGAYQQALHLLPTLLLASRLKFFGLEPDREWPRRRLVSASFADGPMESLRMVEAQRRSQRLEAMERHARELLLEAHLNAKASLWQSLKDAVENQSLNAYSAARRWVLGESNDQEPTS